MMISKLVKTPFLRSVSVGFNQFSRSLSPKPRKYMEKQPEKEELFKVVGDFNLETLTLSQYDNTMTKIKMLFPYVNYDKYGLLRRTVCKSDGLKSHKLFVFFKVSDGFNVIKLILSRARGNICALKTDLGVQVFDNAVLSDEFLHNGAIDNNRISIADYPLISDPFLSYSLDNMKIALGVLALGVESPKSDYYANCLHLITNLAFGGVTSPKMKKFCSDILLGKEYDSTAEMEGFEWWEKVSAMFLEGGAVTEYVDVVKVPWGYTPPLKAELKVCLEKERCFYKTVKENMSVRRDRDIAEAAFQAAKDGADEFEYFSNLEYRKFTSSELGIARSSWDHSKSIYI